MLLCGKVEAKGVLVPKKLNTHHDTASYLSSLHHAVYLTWRNYNVTYVDNSQKLEGGLQRE